MRLDLYLTEKKLTETRTRAKNLIEMGNVTVNGQTVQKPATNVSEYDVVKITEDYDASVASLKLKKAFTDFNPNAKNKICLDLGAANGGFTDVLLNNGAKKVYALDIGECALPDRLKNDEKVVVVDRTNARYIEKTNFADEINLITGDLSFISLKYILLPSYNVLSEGGEAIFLIKPQFELDSKRIPKSGIIRDEKVRNKIVSEIRLFAENIGYKVNGITPAPHPFADKNQEYLIYLSK